jgi:hypothetical protein
MTGIPNLRQYLQVEKIRLPLSETQVGVQTSR